MDLRIARRYAMALLQAAQGQNSVAETEIDLESLSRIFDSRREFREFLESAKIPREKKLAAIDKLLSDRLRPITLRLLRLLVDKGRERELPGIHAEFIRLREDSDGILRTHITSAVALSEAEVKGICDRIAQQTGKTIFAETTVQPELMGGVRVQYGNSVLDGSVSGALKRLKEKLFIDVLKQA